MIMDFTDLDLISVEIGLMEEEKAMTFCRDNWWNNGKQLKPATATPTGRV